MKALKYIIPLILAFLGLLLYSNVLYGPFIFDDEQYIVNNHQIRDISLFLKDFSGTRYVGLLSFAINYYFGGLNTFGYHLVNIVIHILNSILVYFLVQITVDRLKAEGGWQEEKPFAFSPLPFACSIIFLVHPIQTQAVSYITQRFTSLATFFYLLALVLYIKGRQLQVSSFKKKSLITQHLNIKRLTLYFLSLFSAVLAMKTKEISFTLPFIIMLYEFTFLNGDAFLKTQTRFLYLLPFLLTISIIPLSLMSEGEGLSEKLRREQLRDIGILPKYNYIITQFSVIVTYMRLLVLPVNQTLWYDYPISISIFEPNTLLSFIFLLSIVTFAVYLYIRSRKTNNDYDLLISFGILWFFITLSVESSIIPLSDVIFEHRIYLPSVGFILSLTAAVLYGFDRLEKRIGIFFYNYLLLIAIIAATILSFSTYKRNILWADNYMMWLDAVKKSPNRADVHNNLGLAYYNQDQLAEAIKEYSIALRLRPDYKGANYNLKLAYYKLYNRGIAHYNQGRFDEAIREFLTVLKIKPDHADAHYNLGLVYKITGLNDEASKEFEAALKLKPDFNEAKQALKHLKK